MLNEGTNIVVDKSKRSKKRRVKVLIIRFSSIGDIVLTTPVIRCVKEQLPNASVHFLSKKTFKAVTEANPYIDKFFYYSKDIFDLIQELRNERYDYIIDLHKNMRSLKIRMGLNVKTFTYRKQNFNKFLLVNFHINFLSYRHISDRSLDAVAPLGIVNDGKGLDYFIPKTVHISISDLPLTHQSGYIGIVIGASYHTKKLPQSKLIELCTYIDYPIVLIGGKEDMKVASEIAKENPEKIVNACGKFGLNESAWLVQQSKLIITHDTGLMHIAAAFDKTILSVWGNTIPNFGMNAYYGDRISKDTQFQVENLSCRPCNKIGKHKCPKGHFKCMREQDVEQIGITAMQFINSMNNE